MYRPVPPRIDLPAMEREIIAWWEEHDIFHRSLAATAGKPTWVFYEGPPTANGTPGTHHVEARVFKDVFPRFKTMQGYHVPRKAGWDCHGLPVELAVEKQLGFTGKQDIEAFGIEAFNAKCRESVHAHVDEFAVMTQRMGYWVDLDQAYWTMHPGYVESVWWSLQQIFNAGLLGQDHRVTPYCPRCGTGLSDHEIAQGYETVVDPSVFVRFPVTGGALLERYPRLTLLVWTTTPWTLVSNTAVAVNPKATYVVARSRGETFLVAEDLLGATLGEEAEILESMPGSALERLPYQQPFDLVEIPDAHYVVLGEYVTTDDGTGLVHQAPAFGADDLAVCRAYDMPVVNPVGADGHFGTEVPLVGGMFFKKADETLVADLQQRGLLFAHVPYEHAYPHCWRCHTPLIYYAQPSWYIRTTQIKDRLLAQNEATNWFPATIQWGRYGDWLHNNIDWALSRDRYWGTPLPIWRCPEDHLTAIGSLAELGELAGRDLTGFDPHRPFVDDIAFPCPTCGSEARRVPEVIDCWYDSGAMPFAQFGYPHAGAAEFAAQYPADFICEAIDQTRGWFYTLMAVGTLVFERSAYRNVVCLGHILDEDGRKMSKHLGNVLEPVPLMDQHGADAVRWFMLAAGSPWQARRVGHQAIEEVARKTLLTYWNTVSFQSLYARAADWSPSDAAPAERTDLDRWLLSQSHQLVREVTEALERFDTQRAGRVLAIFVDEVSNWYVRRSRRRFWEGDPAALATLHEALRIMTLTMAPFTPFITERVWQDLFAGVPGEPDSVHLASWPGVDEAAIDAELAADMAMVRRVVELGRAARAGSGVRNRQPLAACLVAGARWAGLSQQLRDEIAEELNVQQVLGLADHAGDLVDVQVKANFRALGKRFAKQTPVVAKAIATADAAALAGQVRGAGTAELEVPDVGPVALSADDLVITETPREGWTVAAEGGDTVALDLHLTDDLVRAGLAREVVRFLQETRKQAGLEITDRIVVRWATEDGGVAAAIDEHAATIADEVLALDFAPGEPADGHAAGSEELRLRVSVARHSEQRQGR
jgi:isoleucyl-tRNA synthetase